MRKIFNQNFNQNQNQKSNNVFSPYLFFDFDCHFDFDLKNLLELNSPAPAPKGEPLKSMAVPLFKSYRDFDRLIIMIEPLQSFYCKGFVIFRGNNNTMKNIEENNQEKKHRMHQGTSRLLYQNARELRERMTEAELILWEHLRMKKLDGFKFRRQHPIGIHILDFYCHKKKLGIELDGGYHETKEQEQLDEERTKILNLQDIRIIRFMNQEILNEIPKLLNTIRQELSK